MNEWNINNVLWREQVLKVAYPYLGPISLRNYAEMTFEHLPPSLQLAVEEYLETI